MKSLLVTLLASLFAAGLPSPPPPAVGPTPAEDWTAITCDGNLLMDYEENRVVFFRNVLVKNPRGSLKADRLDVFFSPDGRQVERAEAYGNPWVKMGDREGTSRKINYYPPEKKAVLLGDAVVFSGENQLRGGKITFYLDREEMEVEEAPDMIYSPDKDYDVDIK